MRKLSNHNHNGTPPVSNPDISPPDHHHKTHFFNHLTGWHLICTPKVMLQNYFLLAWRHLTKKKVYSVINIAGLSTGMTIALLIGLWINDELSFDHYFPNHQRLAIVLESDS